MHRLSHWIIATVVLVISTLAARGALLVFEAEDTAQRMVTRHSWYDSVTTNELSGGAWISHFSKDVTGEVAYAIDIAEAGEYTVWLRANPTAAYSWRMDSTDWQPVNVHEAVDRRNIAADGKIDLRFIAWVQAGSVTLDKGEHTLVIAMHSANENHGALDQIVLASEPFAPYGMAVPSAARGVVRVFSSNDSWAFDPADDTFATNAVFDLRQLNEDYAGQHGFIQRSPDGMSFVRGDGQPIRFWSAVDGVYRKTPAQMEQHCRFIAKLGVNMVRIHAGLHDGREGARVTDINDKELDGIFRFVAACKTNGIYLTISPYWAHSQAPKSWGIEGYDGAAPWGVLFFNQKMQEGYKAWVRELYTRTNQYTGVPLKDEPAVAIIQVKNEDSLLFWTFSRIAEPQMKILRQRYGAWLLQKYGAWDAVSNAWAGTRDAKDDFDTNSAGFLNLWEMTAQAPPARGGRVQRLADQTEFMAWIQHKFYADMGRYYRDTLGCKQLINAMNWKSADPVVLDDIERWTYTANEVIAVNRYTGARHIGENNGYRVDPGHFYQNRPVVKNPETLPSALKQVAGHPFIITESSWVFPELYQSEGPMLIAAHMSLTGVDSYYWFALGETTWLRDPRRLFWPVRTSHALGKWDSCVPQQIGMFPANALAFRLGYIAEAATPVVYEERALENMWRRTVPIISEEAKFDPNRDEGAFAQESAIKQDVDPLAFWVGPVHVKYGGSETNSYVAPDLAAYIDRPRQTVRSVTSELALDYGTGVFTVNAPKYQGVAGFLLAAGGTFALRDVTIKSSNDYAAIAVTALDNQPLNASRQLLVQVGTVARPGGWTTEEKYVTVGEERLLMEEILDTGKPPWRVINTRATLTVNNPALSRATLLDIGGYRARPVTVTRDEEQGTLTVQLPLTTMYLVIE